MFDADRTCLVFSKVRLPMRVTATHNVIAIFLSPIVSMFMRATVMEMMEHGLLPAINHCFSSHTRTYPSLREQKSMCLLSLTYTKSCFGLQ